MTVKFSRTPAELRKWFDKNHTTADELIVGYYKKGSGKPSITWPESVDEALCVGWIDGIRRTVDDGCESVRSAQRKQVGHLRGCIQARQGGVEVSSGTATGLSKESSLVGDERQDRGNPTQAVAEAD